MGKIKIFRIGIALFLLILSVLIVWRLRQGGAAGRAVDTGVDSLNLHYLFFDRENRKSLEVWCRTSRKQGEDRLLLTGIRALVFRKGKMDRDLTITGDSGNASSNFVNFAITRNARISGSDLLLESGRFELLDLEQVRATQPVRFRIKNIAGRAERGLQADLPKNDYRLSSVAGSVQVKGSTYQHREQYLHYFRDQQLLLLEGVEDIHGEGTQAGCSHLRVEFSAADSQFLKRILASENCRLEQVKRLADGRLQTRLVESGTIENLYDERGRLRQTVIRENGRLRTSSGSVRTDLAADEIRLLFDPHSGAIRSAHASAGTLTQEGRRALFLSAGVLDATFSAAAEIESFQARTGSLWRLGDWRGIGGDVVYDGRVKRITLSGPACEVYDDRNRFAAGEFVIDTSQELLSTSTLVKATIQPDIAESLFSKKPMFVRAGRMQFSQREQRFAFSSGFRLRQDELEMSGGRVEFDSPRQAMAARGQISLTFQSGENRVTAGGESLRLDAQQRRLLISGQAQLASGTNLLKARQLELFFSGQELQSVIGRQDTHFSNRDLEGQADELEWRYRDDLAVFRRSAQIRKQGAVTSGIELRVDLKKNEILGR